MNDVWDAPDLSGLVAVVTGASRGVGRGIADVLAECGARTYRAARTGADACDVGDAASVDALFERVRREEGHLEILVNNAVGWTSDSGEEGGAMPFLMEPPWRAPGWWWDSNFEVGVRSHYTVTNAAAALMTEGRRGIVIFTSERQPDEPGMQELVLDLRATVVARMAFLYSLHLRPHRVSSVLLYPGFTRTESIQASFERRDPYFDGWTEERYLTETGSMHFAGRAAAVLAAASLSGPIARTGALITSVELAREHGFTDIDGRRPDPI